MHTGAEGLSRTPRKDDSRIARQSLSPAAIVSPKGEVSPTPASVTEGSSPLLAVGAIHESPASCTFPPLSLRTSAHTGVAIRLPLSFPLKGKVPVAPSIARRHTGAEWLSRTPRKDDSRIACQSLSPAAMASPARGGVTDARVGDGRVLSPPRRRGDSRIARLLHVPTPVIANQCAHWCGNPFLPVFSRDSYASPYSPSCNLSKIMVT